ncbi:MULTISPECIES: helix-turn-helix domain-containing protein [Streptomyces]|uniref:Helix-turn-helix domain-containing protein n=1 Tax=Streptomyces eurythermus TaxID=42237 RepID=A0ABW6Z9R8_9ACTN|nr:MULTISPECIES: helix-turn-helix transcriptional regulator [Streptomyces]QIS74958.1 helix-turn-helix domain-containing protein [Streptomyces sp. DSM 40868]
MAAIHNPRPDLVVPMQNSGETLSGRMLGDELRRLRERRGYTLADAARVIRASTSKVSRLERGQNPVKYRDLNDLAEFYGVSREERAHLDHLHQQVGNEDLIQRFNDVTPAFFKRLIRLERAAHRITVYEPRVVPGLLQTEGYARALVRLTEIDRSDRDIELIVRLRMERQLMLDGEFPRLAALIYERALYQPYGPSDMMAEQMYHLRDAAKADKVNVRILPKQFIALPTPIFHLMFPDGEHQELAYVEHANSANYITQRAELDRTRKQLTNICNNVYDREDSVSALERAIDYWEQSAAEEQPG